MPAPKPIDHVWTRIKRGAPDECWLWAGGVDSSGYGQLRFQRRLVKAHRVVLLLAGVDIEGKDVMHLCDNPPCCNPAHLRPGTRSENNLDASRKGRWPQGKGESNANATLTEAKVREMRAAWENIPRHPNGIVKWRETAKLAAKFGVADRLLYRVGTRQVWKHVK